MGVEGIGIWQLLELYRHKETIEIVKNVSRKSKPSLNVQVTSDCMKLENLPKIIKQHPTVKKTKILIIIILMNYLFAIRTINQNKLAYYNKIIINNN